MMRIGVKKLQMLLLRLLRLPLPLADVVAAEHHHQAVEFSGP